MKKLFNIEDLESDWDDELLDITEEDIKNNLNSYSSTKLAEIVVAARYIGLYKDLSIDAMQELSRRRSNGDEFDYEKYIENSINSLPKLDFSSFSGLAALINQFKGFRK